MASEVVASMFLVQTKCKWFKKWTKEDWTELNNQELQPKVATSSEAKVEEEDLMPPSDLN